MGRAASQRWRGQGRLGHTGLGTGGTRAVVSGLEREAVARRLFSLLVTEAQTWF